MFLVIFTGATALVLEGSFLTEPGKFLLVLLGLYLSGGSANALNQYFERNIDSLMKRTSSRRPLPQNKLSPTHALIFSTVIGLSGVALFAYFFNVLTAGLALGNILFYAFFYTLYLKPNTPQNIVIGGIAGAMAPVGAWTAVTGEMALTPWILFAIIFFWTPPHFWALALYCKEDYREVRLPMMPLIKGDKSTVKQIFYYSVVVVIVSLALTLTAAGWFYSLIAVVLGGLFISKAYALRASLDEKAFRGLFGYSILYLFGLFTAIMLDGFVAGLI